MNLSTQIFVMINDYFTIFRSLLVTRGICICRTTKIRKLIRQLKYRYTPPAVNTVITCKHERMINSGNFQVFPRVRVKAGVQQMEHPM